VGLVLCIPITLCETVACTGIVLASFFPHLGLIYYTTIRTDRLGPNLKVVGCLTFWLLALLWPFLLFFLTLFGAFFGSIFYPVFATFEKSGYFFWETGCEDVKASWKAMKFVWTLHYKDFPEFLKEKRQPHPGVEPYEIRFHKLPLCLLAAACGCLIDGVCVGAVLLARALPILGMTYYHVWRGYAEIDDLLWRLLCFIPVLLLRALIPVGWLLVMIALLIFGFMLGACAPWPAYKDGFVAAMKASWGWVLAADDLTSAYLKPCCGCLLCPRREKSDSAPPV
jgi:hypothetical protein